MVSSFQRESRKSTINQLLPSYYEHIYNLLACSMLRNWAVARDLWESIMHGTFGKKRFLVNWGYAKHKNLLEMTAFRVVNCWSFREGIFKVVVLFTYMLIIYFIGWGFPLIFEGAFFFLRRQCLSIFRRFFLSFFFCFFLLGFFLGCIFSCPQKNGRVLTLFKSKRSRGSCLFKINTSMKMH